MPVEPTTKWVIYRLTYFLGNSSDDCLCFYHKIDSTQGHSYRGADGTTAPSSHRVENFKYFDDTLPKHLRKKSRFYLKMPMSVHC